MSSHLFLISWAGNNNGGALVLEPVYVVKPALLRRSGFAKAQPKP